MFPIEMAICGHSRRQTHTFWTLSIEYVSIGLICWHVLGPQRYVHSRIRTSLVGYAVHAVVCLGPVRWQYSYEAWATGSPSLVFMPPVESWNLHDSSTHMDMDQNWIHMILQWENLRESSAFSFPLNQFWEREWKSFVSIKKRPWIFLSHWLTWFYESKTVWN